MPKRRISATDLTKLLMPSDPRISTDGERIVFTVKSVNEKQDGYDSALFTFENSSGKVRPLTYGKNDRMGRFLPNENDISFLRDLAHRCAIMKLPAGGGEAEMIFQMPYGDLQDYEPSPDGRWLALLFQPETDGLQHKSDGTPESRLYVETERLYYRLDGKGYDTAPFAGLYILRTDNGKLIKISPEIPSPVRSFAWDAQGDRLIYTANIQDDPDRKSDYDDIFIYDMKSRETMQVEKPAGPVALVRLNHAGDTVIFSGHFKPESGWGVENMGIHSIRIPDMILRSYTDKLDRSVESLTIGDITPSFGKQMLFLSPDDRFLYFTVSSEGGAPLLKLDLQSGEIDSILEGPEVIISYSATPDGKSWAFHLAQLERPDELWHFTIDDNERTLKRITQLNDPFLENVEFKIPEVHTISGEGALIQAFILKPPRFKEDKKYPLLLQIHGGPRGQYGYTWFHEMHVFAAAGFVVLYTNPQGSQGFGRDFADAITGKWGQPAMDDVMAAVDYVIGLGCIDESKLFITGGSYGGYLTNWIISHSKRFKAAITQRCVSNLESFYYSSDMGWEIAKEFGGTPWEKPELYKKWSPISYVDQIITPLLIIHSDNDLRCPAQQAEELYVRLKMANKPVSYLRFPESSHGLSRNGHPARRVIRLEKMVDFLKSHLE
jgi:dipeptidyl aminopeptidase/acylaminoacyl peptidase